MCSSDRSVFEYLLGCLELLSMSRSEFPAFRCCDFGESLITRGSSLASTAFSTTFLGLELGVLSLMSGLGSLFKRLFTDEFKGLVELWLPPLSPLFDTEPRPRFEPRAGAFVESSLFGFGSGATVSSLSDFLSDLSSGKSFLSLSRTPFSVFRSFRTLLAPPRPRCEPAPPLVEVEFLSWVSLLVLEDVLRVSTGADDS